jgi:cyclohexanone monooxygenase
MSESSISTNSAPEAVDVLVVGAGLAGLYILYCLRKRGLTARAFEAGSDVGGTWYWNRYPGARVDVESMQYCYHFSDELTEQWRWTEKFAAQPELLRYVNYVADRFELRRDVKFDTRVSSAVFDDESNIWTLTTDQGDIATAPYCIMATGSLSKPYQPPFPGMEDFAGDWYHTAMWPHEEVDFTGKRVGIVGTGSTGIQAIPVLAAQAKHLTVFQRTANYSTPAGNRPLGNEEQRAFNEQRDQWKDDVRHTFAGMTGFPVPTRSHRDETPEQRREFLENRWREGGMPQSMLATYKDVSVDEGANAVVADFIRGKIRELVKDPDVAAILSPSKDLPIGSKRPPIDTNYFDTFNRDNVTLVDVKKAPIDRVTPNGIQIGAAEYDLDAIVFATGFDAMTGTLLAIDIRTSNGVTLHEAWADGPSTYMGLMVAGIPNLFMINGPGSPSVKTNMIVALEQHTDWIMALLDHMTASDLNRVEATGEVQASWMEHTRELAEATLMPRADSWYVGANIPGKKRVYMPYFGGFERYIKQCDEVVADGYRGFKLSCHPGATSAASVAAD